MSKIYLFDWGDTLMVDFPEQHGKMCSWPKVQAVEGALATLKALSKEHLIYVATNAADSCEQDIQLALERVGLSPFINGYFCKANLGIGKGTPEFFHKITERLGVKPQSIIMVGDSYDKDIEPAFSAGIQAIWFNPSITNSDVTKDIKQIHHLSGLYT
ncbi:HAD family hydrolase [Paraglaciecola arctica]|uniref:HAD family hydrolase n=1 Tax=Paraglaciecola arctica TaxID=1128911 RepID=UPI001C06774D|nr:HAD family hydrolase [Paraglaciecola arctica]MBU3003972.1 HAD family hydrolase [Paraglaciecola arctica]